MKWIIFQERRVYSLEFAVGTQYVPCDVYKIFYIIVRHLYLILQVFVYTVYRIGFVVYGVDLFTAQVSEETANYAV